MLGPIHLRAHSSKLPNSVNLLVPMLNGAIAVASMSDGGEIKIRVALMCSANLMDGNNLRVRHPLVANSANKVLSADEWVSYEIGRAQHRNEFLRLHVREALLTNDAIVHLPTEGQTLKTYLVRPRTDVG